MLSGEIEFKTFKPVWRRLRLELLERLKRHR
jgi:hypothetical protein